MSGDPIQFINQCIGKHVEIKCRLKRTITGILNAVDPHLNIMMSNVEETGENLDKKIETRKIPILYIRGDTIIGISPQKEEDIEQVNMRDRLANPNYV